MHSKQNKIHKDMEYIENVFNSLQNRFTDVIMILVVLYPVREPDLRQITMMNKKIDKGAIFYGQPN